MTISFWWISPKKVKTSTFTYFLIKISTSFAINSDDFRTQYEPLRNFVNSFFPDKNHPIRTNKVADVMDYINNITIALRDINKYYSTSYFIERDKTNH